MERRTRLSKTLFCLFVIVPAFWASTALGAMEINVTPDNPDIQAAIDAAGSGDTVVVADGTYFGPLSIVAKSLTIKSQHGSDSCAIVIGENQTGTVITFSGSETAGSVLSGFTISGGNGVGYGGGIACLGGSSPTISDCDIENNSSNFGGGGLYIKNSSPTIEECSISNNDGGYFGGGVYITDSSEPKLLSCLIVHNSADYYGGGILSASTYASSPIITNCTLADNRVDNPDYSEGGGIFSASSFPRITNSILWNNAAASGPEIYLTSYNSNSSPDDPPSKLAVSYSDVKGGEKAVVVDNSASYSSTLIWDGTNIDKDPLFVGPDDYHLSPGSPCIDAGTDTVDLPEFDFEGEDPRILNGKPDMGADETTETEVIVDIDIKPGSGHKEIDLRDKGVVPVAVLSSKDFDARMIDPKSVHFANAAPVRFVLNNVYRNYHLDMLFFFKTQQLDLDENSSEATLTGKTVEGVSFKGTGSVTIYKPKWKAKTLWKSAKIKHRYRHKHGHHRYCSK
jgi:hypothetical protein